VTPIVLRTPRLDLRPLPAAVAARLPFDRDGAAAALGLALSRAWPLPDLRDVLPMQAAASPEAEPFGVWVMAERETRTVIGDIGLMGPPDEDGLVETGYSVVPERRRLGLATEALAAMVAWALEQPRVLGVIARCDAGNAPSRRALERAGFRVTGTDGGGMLTWRRDP
jgi:RimJ/RimL family protein N-acetyltransferase